MAIKCPRCQSENVQKYVIAYEAGVDCEGDYEMEASQAALTQQTTPPRKFSYTISFFFACGVCLMLQFTTSMSPVIPYLTFLVIAGGGLYMTLKFNFSKWPRLMEEWKKSFICLECGHSFIIDE